MSYRDLRVDAVGRPNIADQMHQIVVQETSYGPHIVVSIKRPIKGKWGRERESRKTEETKEKKKQAFSIGRMKFLGSYF
ncbi:hypothetical protein MRB53_022740 [Persea americana]|uniref:Uncharacterized protein n=1 Tax=Persea americana TaxID=3435 RepID=A0ACC2L8I0_PERAE|nr:hypothetical protein MRB53_022740 [Persea americana]